MAKEEKKPAKNTKAVEKKKRRPGLVAYVKAAWQELKKVVWPSKKDLFKSTCVTIAIIAAFAVVIFLLDTVFSTLTNLIYNLM